MIIIGIDPGTATTGFGVINYDETAQQKLSCLKYGIIATPVGMETAERLNMINLDLRMIIDEFSPGMAAIESLYFFKNMKTVMPVSQARGVILLTAYQKKIPIAEYTPLQAKTAVTGYGRATKNQVQQMVKNLLGLEKIPKPDDAADALALAICCANHTRFKI
ncbi:MAG: crossover junction endodeoxyribonuclease RuvC [Minisyncoccus archaeiphilus]|jgi:crossover junction endodeoxyribonuclease RuvC|uniref:crossover junction endodeoxyribonuclease RuvC n=1 Tax=Minisyncoccus archaeiphilus TaxID=3238481 RepID=UPI0009D2E748|nr:MAG: Crossover junction endodeoxyribonuclease RuvC [Parcubacteria group bacterium ADurb.Bin216]GMX59043.1 MAG: crossover junction endodeoxyribonuclease RuvC [Candidatus Parcubacteria bacterium]